MLSLEENLERQIYYREIFPKSTFDAIRKRRPRLWSIKKYDIKLNELKEHGFTNPAKIIISNPEILGRKTGSVKKMIEHLRRRGFDNPVRILDSCPGIFCLSFNNIDRKIRFARRIGYSRFCELIAYHPMLLDLSIKRYFFVARTLKNHKGEIAFSLIYQTQKLMSKGE